MLTRAPRPTSRWVTKSDIVQYERCPYAFWLIDQGEVVLEEIMGEAITLILDEGHAFEESVVADVPVLEATPEDLPALFKTKMTLFNPPLLKNRALKLAGKPDAIETDRGKLIPVEIKSHRRKKFTDILELAFYWILLEPYRTRRSDPKGILILRDVDGNEEREEVEISEYHLARVRRLIKEVRHARKHGVEPELCLCIVCAGRPEIATACRARGSPSLLYGVAAKTCRALEKIGIRTMHDLAACDPDATSAALHEVKRFVSPGQIRSWQGHIRAYDLNAPVSIGDKQLPFADFIVVDLEYDSRRHGLIWLIGIAIVIDGAAQYTQLWADDHAIARENLRKLVSIIESHPDLPVATWSGISAELPQLQDSIEHYGLEGQLDQFFARHFDMFVYAESNVRLPIPTLDLKSVGKFFGHYRTTDIRGGMEAAFLHRQYLDASDEERARIKRDLISYNLEDLEALVHIINRFKSLASELASQGV